MLIMVVAAGLFVWQLRQVGRAEAARPTPATWTA